MFAVSLESSSFKKVQGRSGRPIHLKVTNIGIVDKLIIDSDFETIS